MAWLPASAEGLPVRLLSPQRAGDTFLLDGFVVIRLTQPIVAEGDFVNVSPPEEVRLEDLID